MTSSWTLLFLIAITPCAYACFLGLAGSCRLYIGQEDYNFFSDPNYSKGDTFVVTDSLVEFEQEFTSMSIGIFLDIDPDKIRLNIVPIVNAAIQNIRINCTLTNGTLSSFRVKEHDFDDVQTDFTRNSFSVNIPPTALERGRRASADFSCSSCEYTSVSSGSWTNSSSWVSTGTIESETDYPVDNCRAIIADGHSVSFANEAEKVDRNMYIDSIIVDSNGELTVGNTAQEHLLRVYDLLVSSSGSIVQLHEGLVMAHTVVNHGTYDASSASNPRGGLYVTESIENDGVWQVGYLTLEAREEVFISGSLDCCVGCVSSTTVMRAGNYRIAEGSSVCAYELHLPEANTINFSFEDESDAELIIYALDILVEPWGIGQTIINTGCGNIRLEPATIGQSTLRYNAGEDFLQNALVWHTQNLELNSDLVLALMDTNRDGWFVVQGTYTYGNNTITENGEGVVIGGEDGRLIVDNSQFTVRHC